MGITLRGLVLNLNLTREDIALLSRFGGVEIKTEETRGIEIRKLGGTDLAFLADNFKMYKGMPVPEVGTNKDRMELYFYTGMDGTLEKTNLPEQGHYIKLLNKRTTQKGEVFLINLGSRDMAVTLEQLDVLSQYYKCKNFTFRHGDRATLSWGGNI